MPEIRLSVLRAFRLWTRSDMMQGFEIDEIVGDPNGDTVRHHHLNASEVSTQEGTTFQDHEAVAAGLG